jgi:c-di-GMP-binding flagellar brake protein YcgR
MKDRRKLERFNLKLRGEITVETAGQMKRVFHLKTRDISSGGAFFYGVDPLPEGTPVQINLILSIDKLERLMGVQARVKISGIVNRSEPSGMAICFHKNYQIMSIKGRRNERFDKTAALELG